MSDTGYRIPDSTPSRAPRRRRSGVMTWVFAGAAGVGLAAILSQCEEKKPAPPPKAEEPTYRTLEAWERPTNAIVVFFNTDGKFNGAAAQTYRQADRTAYEDCAAGRGRDTLCYSKVIYQAEAAGKVCAAIGVDYLKALTREQRLNEEKATDYVITTTNVPAGADIDQKMKEAQDSINAACDARPGRCAYGKFLYCNFPAWAPHGTQF